MLVKELLASKNRNLITIEPEKSVLDAMKLLIQHGITCLMVLGEKGELAGIVSDKDIYRAVAENHKTFDQLVVSDIWTKDLIIGLKEDDLDYIAGLMTNNKIRHIPIVDGVKLIGFISPGDIIKAQHEDIKTENRYLKTYIQDKYPA